MRRPTPGSRSSSVTRRSADGGSIYIREKNEFHHFDKVSDNAVLPAGPKGLFTMNLIFNHAVMKYSPEKETAKALLEALV